MEEINTKYTKLSLEVIVFEIIKLRDCNPIIVICIYRPPQTKQSWWKNFND